MATSTNVTTHLYDSYEQASEAVRALEGAGVPSSDISIISRQDGEIETVDEASGAATGATVGTALGAGAGLLTGLGIMAIPGVGPVVAAGWLATTLVGAATGMAAGGVIGALTDHGVSEGDAHVLAEGMRRGGTVVSVRTTSMPRETIADIMSRHDPVDMSGRGTAYRNEGWNRFEDRVDAVGKPRVDPLQRL